MNFRSLKQKAKADFKAEYYLYVGIIIAMATISAIGIALTSWIPVGGAVIASSFVIAPLSVSICRFALNNREGYGTFEDILYSFKTNWLNIGIVMFKMKVTIFLWSLCLIVPGIIKKYQYAMVPFILAENPDITWEEASEISTEMMEGNKMDLFLLQFSFFGWIMLGLITSGLAIGLYGGPYITQTMAEAYEYLKKCYITSGGAIYMKQVENVNFNKNMFAQNTSSYNTQNYSNHNAYGQMNQGYNNQNTYGQMNQNFTAPNGNTNF
ncbi:DUF975 family protein [Butyrivibrio sp. NC3005]|uniref:DUF975 family protein n=1 Tax=Butyrivibrio sp. NC3005 TaxID=1280685 RepID=UPI0004057E8A|nr:DUF975 family protein [Butyrivibrio sp. NC3005]